MAGFDQRCKEEIQEARARFDEDKKARGSGYLSIMAGISSRIDDDYPSVLGNFNVRTQPLQQHLRLANGYLVKGAPEVSEPMSLVALHAWISWVLLEEPQKDRLAFPLPRATQRGERSHGA